MLTGVPRGGTTLTCHLLGGLPNAVALHEPIPPGYFAEASAGGAEEVAAATEAFYRRMRRMIRRHGVAFSKPIGRRITDFKEKDLESDLARRAAGKGGRPRSEQKLRINKELSPGFTLIIKSPALFSAFLPVLAARFPAYAVVRNPLAVLSSWDSWENTTKYGHSPAAERYDTELKGALASAQDRTERQLRLLSWYFERYGTLLPEENVVRYEDVVSSGGRVLSVVVPGAANLDEPLEERNRSPVYDRENAERLAERLLSSEGAYWRFYAREDVEGLLAAL